MKIIVTILLLIFPYITFAWGPWYICKIDWKIIKKEIINKDKCFDIIEIKINSYWKIYDLKWIIKKDNKCIENLQKKEVNLIYWEYLQWFKEKDIKSFKLIGEHFIDVFPDPMIIEYSSEKSDFKDIQMCNINYIEFKNIYINIFIIWAWIISLIILWIIFYNKFKK